MAAAALALVGLLLSIYLLLYKLGITAPAVCGAGSACERVQLGRWGMFLGLPVAAYGVGGYLAILAVSVAGLQERWASHPGPTRWLAALSGLGVLFSLYLTYLELFVIHAVCKWCVASAIIIAGIFGVSMAGLVRRER